MPPLQPSFASLGVPSDIVAALDRKSITEPFPIQVATIPDALGGRDVCGMAPTGSGKTLAFGIGAVARLTGKPSRPKHPRVLVLTPTRELAAQVATELRALATPRQLRVDSFYGGVGYGPQLKALSRGVDVAVACPGRLGDLIERGSIFLDAVEIVVVDEADRMADMGFLPDVRRILDLTPDGRQTLLFSATLDGDIDVLVRRYQHDPARHELEADGDDITAATHLFWKVASGNRVDRTAEVVLASGPTIVFCRTKHGTDRIARQLGQRGVRAAAIHGDRSQKQRDRALDSFIRGAVDALVATDVAARGIHVDGVNAVVHFDPPTDSKDYVHRSGRTARAGATGVVVSLVSPEKATVVKRIQRDLGFAVGTTHPDIGAVTAVIGEPPPRRPSDPRVTTEVQKGAPRSRGAGPERTGRPTKPWKARPSAGGNGASAAGTPTTRRPGGSDQSGLASPGHAGGGRKKNDAASRRRRAASGHAGTGRSGAGRSGTGGHSGGSGGQRRGAPVGSKRSTGSSGGSGRGR
jgi:superfamily II DNA/RNA helicase